MDEQWRLGFIGAGVMAETMIVGVRDGDGFTPERIQASGPGRERLEELQQRHGIRVTSDNGEVAAESDLLVLAVKPQTLAEVLVELHDRIPERTQVLTIVAGATLETVRKGLGHQRVARAMPNVACRIRKGLSVWTGAEGHDAERIAQVLRGMGAEIRVDHETDVDRATAVNGTGPAIVAEFVKAFVEAANYIGEPRRLAHESVLATLLGTAEMIRESGEHVAQLIDEVSSPGGTTSRALQVLKRGRMAAVLTDAVDAAYLRTVELGRVLDEELHGKHPRLFRGGGGS